MKKWNIVAMAAVLATAVGTFGGVYAAEKLKIGFIYVGPVGDLGHRAQTRGRRARTAPARGRAGRLTDVGHIKVYMSVI